MEDKYTLPMADIYVPQILRQYSFRAKSYLIDFIDLRLFWFFRVPQNLMQ